MAQRFFTRSSAMRYVSSFGGSMIKKSKGFHVYDKDGKKIGSGKETIDYDFVVSKAKPEQKQAIRNRSVGGAMIGGINRPDEVASLALFYSDIFYTTIYFY